MAKEHSLVGNAKYVSFGFSNKSNIKFAITDSISKISENTGVRFERIVFVYQSRKKWRDLFPHHCVRDTLMLTSYSHSEPF